MNQSIRRLNWIAISFLAVSTLTRIGLAVFSDDVFQLSEWLRFLAVGAVYDLVVLAWILLPWTIYEAVRPRLSPRFDLWERCYSTCWAALYLAAFLVLAVAEFAFWAEFGSRFDFIAVDYLVYTHEVLGNIRESYPVGIWLGTIAAVCLPVSILTWPAASRADRPGPWVRWGAPLAVASLALAGTALADIGLADAHPNAYVQQLSTNGIFAFAHAYRNNEIDYERYYPTLPVKQMDRRIRTLVSEPNATFVSSHGIERQVSSTRAMRPVNVVLVSVESLSAEYLSHFGNDAALTPNLDDLAERGLLFTHLYATGTRTVRGLEALSIGTPPTPGQSIVRRPNNANLENLGEELNENGWTPYWIYGGYGFFDNMNAYFQANHYTVIDRENIAAEGLPVHHQNIWGVADEDLFSLALLTLDREYSAGGRFFAHIMTTSNHRPYTFPENRIDLPQRHRSSAVKYTDWAIGDFIRRCRQKPWFDNTLFVIVADHTAKAAGKTDLPPERYHIPMIWFAPKLIDHGVEDRLMSQVDLGPTLMGWLGLSYDSRFFGYDIFQLPPGRERAFISTYQKLGLLKAGRLVVLDVNQSPVVEAGITVPGRGRRHVSDRRLVREAISWYQGASQMYGAGFLKENDEPLRLGTTNAALLHDGAG